MSDPRKDDRTSVTIVCCQPRNAPDHGQHLDITHAEAFLTAHPVVQLADTEQHATADKDAEDRGRPSRRQHEREGQAGNDP